MARIKYIRVSTTHQNTERQEQNAGEFDKIFVDHASGRDVNRPEFLRMLEYVREGDIVVFESFSRISRSLPDLLKILDAFEQKGVAWVSEREHISTEGASGRLIVSILGALAQYEREINKERREYGFQKAMGEGRVGRPKKQLSEEQLQIIRQWQEGHITAVQAMQLTNLHKPFFYRYVKENGIRKITPGNGGRI